jgi:hypothetical protein
MKDRKQRGQALILIALAFVGLAAFIGLAVDGGILFIQYGHLRRAVDAASLSAANQFREGRTIAQLTASALQVLELNGLNPAAIGVSVETCDTSPGDVELCPQSGEAPRKLVRVSGSVTAYFAFLPIIGLDSWDLHASAISEAASIDIVLTLDSSESETYDASCTNTTDDDAWAETNLDAAGNLCLGCGAPDGDPNDGCSGNPVLGNWADDYMRDPDHCNPFKECHPFREVQDAAVSLTSRLLPPYDRMAIITFDMNVVVQMNLNYQAVSGVSNAQYLTDLGTQIMALNVFKLPNCPGWSTGDPTGCTSTDTADALEQAGNQFGLFKREEAVWIVILLSDGGANAARDSLNQWICPGSPNAADWVQPFCRDPIAGTRHTTASAVYDPDDAARDKADWVGCMDSNTPPAQQYGTCAALAPTYGQGAVIFTIGLGDLVVDNEQCDVPVWGGMEPGGQCEPDTGEQLLRYVANVGDDGDPRPSSDPCASAATGTNCGNYYYSPTGSGLLKVFEAIASRIFTRITH